MMTLRIEMGAIRAMHYLSVILLGIAANLDNLAIGMVYGLRGIRLPFPSNLVMALLSGLAIYVSGWCGRLLTQVIPEQTANLLGGSIVALMGIWVGWVYLRDHEKYKIFPIQCEDEAGEGMTAIFQNPEKADIDNSGDISWQEALALGFALAANCLTMGVGVGITGLSLAGVTLAVTLSSLLAITVGLFLGKRYGSTFLGNYATPAAGIILVLVGVYEMLI
ncbi:MAG: sporulation membrane protein YtaF [Methylocystaceae bacterium]